MILVIDNFDSFVYNLARYLEELGQDVEVLRNDAIDVATARSLQPDAIVLSPGPCDPDRAGVSVPIVRELGGSIPILGVCLGHQAIGVGHGGTVIRHRPTHGRATAVLHDGRGLFAGLPQAFPAARYHSLVVRESDLPAELEVSARAPDGTLMALRHRLHSTFGVQFHPESILTEHGHAMLANFLVEAGIRATDEPLPLGASTRESSTRESSTRESSTRESSTRESSTRGSSTRGSSTRGSSTRGGEPPVEIAP